MRDLFEASVLRLCLRQTVSARSLLNLLEEGMSMTLGDFIGTKVFVYREHNFVEYERR